MSILASLSCSPPTAHHRLPTPPHTLSEWEEEWEEDESGRQVGHVGVGCVMGGMHECMGAGVLEHMRAGLVRAQGKPRRSQTQTLHKTHTHNYSTHTPLSCS